DRSDKEGVARVFDDDSSEQVVALRIVNPIKVTLRQAGGSEPDVDVVRRPEMGLYNIDRPLIGREDVGGVPTVFFDEVPHGLFGGRADFHDSPTALEEGGV